MKKYDLIVIGAGPGGYVAAIRAAHLGLKTAIVEKDSSLGGTCLLRGCIPTKSLLHSADLLEEAQKAAKEGILSGEVEFNFSGVQKARKKIIKKSAAGVNYLMKSNKIDVHKGMGSLKNSTTVVVDGEAGTVELGAKHIILATGSVPRNLPFIPIDGKYILTSDEILELKTPPKSLIIMGSGAVGVEFASIYSRFGTKVRVIELLDRCLPNEDKEVSEEFQKLFKKRGIPIHTGTQVKQAKQTGDHVVVTIDDGKKSTELEADMLLVAVGRAPLTTGLNLEKVGVEVDQGGCIQVDGFMRTSVPSVFAIGDIVRTPQLAHVASAEAILAVDCIAGKNPRPINYLHNPGCTYSDPEVASVGMTQEQAIEAGFKIKVGKFPFSAIGKARIMDKAEGFVKIVSDAKYDEILGIHIIGPRATDLIAEACVALKLESTTEELAQTIHPHPTLTEGVLEAAHAALGRPIHM